MSNNVVSKNLQDVDSFMTDIVNLKIRINGDAISALSELMKIDGWHDAFIMLAMTGRKKGVTFSWERESFVQKMFNFFYPRHKKLQRMMKRHGFTLDQYQRFYSNVFPEDFKSIQGIAEQVYIDYQTNGRIAVPDEKKAIAISSRMSSDASDKRRLLHLLFEDGSALSIDTRLSVESLSIAFSEPGESNYKL